MRRVIKQLTSAGEFVGLARHRERLDRLPAGDGHLVVTVPGLFATDASMTLLRRFLRSKNYQTQGWRMGLNRGSVEMFDEFARRLSTSIAANGQPVSLIGWSLGGICSRWAAHLHPELVRQVITLGSPFMQDPRDQTIWPVYRAVSGSRASEFTREKLDAVAATPAMPTTSIASRDDLIVPLHGAYQAPGPTSETIEIDGAHTALGRNPAAWAIIADRLAQPAGTWAPYQRTAVSR